MKKIILVIDDDETMNAIVGAILREAGHDVWTANSYDQGLSKVRSVRPDFIILDLHLGTQDGGDLLAQIRANPKSAETPVLMLSGEMKTSEIRRVMQGGANHYMVKPFTPQDLLNKINIILRQQK